jgi:hypothetical protein
VVHEEPDFRADFLWQNSQRRYLGQRRPRRICALGEFSNAMYLCLEAFRSELWTSYKMDGPLSSDLLFEMSLVNQSENLKSSRM